MSRRGVVALRCGVFFYVLMRLLAEQKTPLTIHSLVWAVFFAIALFAIGYGILGMMWVTLRDLCRGFWRFLNDEEGMSSESHRYDDGPERR